MPDAGHEGIEHTADLAIRAWAPDLRGLIEQAALGMIELMVEGPPGARDRREVRGEGAGDEELLVDCLREILLLIDLQGAIPVDVEVLEVADGEALCRVGTVPLSERAEALVQDIKAVTYHGLEVREVGGGLEVEVVFDV